jgi:hypothetical protein
MTRKSNSGGKAKVTTEAPAKASTKVATLVGLMRRPSGATLDEMTAATGWQVHSVRGAISGSVKKTLGLVVVSEKVEGLRRYSIAAEHA